MEKNNIETLFEKYLQKTISEEELSFLYDFFQMEENQEELEVLLMAYFYKDAGIPSEQEEKSEIVMNLAWKGVQHHLGIQESSKYKRISWLPRVAAAAGMLLVLSFSFYFYNKFAANRQYALKVSDLDIPPGTNRATLTASNGKVYQLNGSKEEIVVDKTSIHYKDGDTLSVQDAIQKVTLSTPRGGQYRVILSDGTRVWLNASSSLLYPTFFNGKERRVELKGEAYFEVAGNALQPFIVHTEDQEVKVLGTSFNINAYKDEDKTFTTLINGSVQLESRGVKKIQLHPGEQAILEKETFGLAAVDVSLYSAWKDGEFRFKATPLIEVMHQIERWYDLDVDYTGIPTDIRIHASIRRDKKLSTVLHALEKIGDIKFEVRGRSIKIMQ